MQSLLYGQCILKIAGNFTEYSKPEPTARYLRTTPPYHLVYSDVGSQGCTSVTEVTLCQFIQVPWALEFSKCIKDTRPQCCVKS